MVIRRFEQYHRNREYGQRQQRARSNVTGHYNTADGFNALFNTSGAKHGGQRPLGIRTGEVAVILHAPHNTTGSNNMAFGYLAGSALTTGSNNIDVGNVGVAAESNTIRIGEDPAGRLYVGN